MILRICIPMSSNSDDKKILLDADVIRHFIKGQGFHYLVKTYPHQLILLDIVKDELFRSKHLFQVLNNMLAMFDIEQLRFPDEQKNVVEEYAHLLAQGFGEGESACMAVARFNSYFIASSNLKDIKQYCEAHNITYLTTMMILVEAKNKGIITDDECNSFISMVKAKGSKLPTNTIQEYIAKYL